jgi:hypothetical protein
MTFDDLKLNPERPGRDSGLPYDTSGYPKNYVPKEGVDPPRTGIAKMHANERYSVFAPWTYRSSRKHKRNGV